MSEYGRYDERSRESLSRATKTAAVVGVIAAVLGVISLVGVIDSFTGSASGQVTVVRNGGWFDSREPFMVIQQGSSPKWTGWWSSTRTYPSTPQQLNFAGGDNADELGVNYNSFPTIDGIPVGVKGVTTITLTTEEGKLIDFDSTYGSRRYRGADGTSRLPSDDIDNLNGWKSFLDAVVKPIADNTLRIKLSGYRCVELTTLCKLVTPQQIVEAKPGQPATPVSNPTADAEAAAAANKNILDIQKAVEDALKADPAVGSWAAEIQVRFNGVELSANARTKVDEAMARWADANKALADESKAAAEARANIARQEGYQKCPICAQIDMIRAQTEVVRAIPPNVTVYAPGGTTSVPLK